MFTPPSTKGTWMLPGTIGGSEWGGAAFDPGTNIIYLKSNESPEIDLLQKVEPAKTTAMRSDYDDGKKIYITYCANCHKADRSGDEPLYPALLDLKKRLPEDVVLNKIKQGGGKMPSFAGVINGHEEGIIDYLFDKTGKRLTQQERDLLEIQNNRLSNVEVRKDKAVKDTAVTYLNVTAYAQLKDPEGHPAIKAPWGTLNAINLNTGDYEWTVPVGPGSPGTIATGGGLA